MNSVNTATNENKASEKRSLVDILKEKLTSRKFWAALLAAALAVTASLLDEALTAEELSALRIGVGALVAYIFGEGAVDLTRLLAEK